MTSQVFCVMQSVLIKHKYYTKNPSIFIKSIIFLLYLIIDYVITVSFENNYIYAAAR